MSIKPVAMLTADEMECLKEGGTAIVIPTGKMLEDDDCIPLYAIPDTHRVVSVELLKTLANVSYYKDAFMDACEEARAIIEDKP